MNQEINIHKTSINSCQLSMSNIVRFIMIDIDRIIVMALEDRTTFEAIHIQFRLSESEVIHLIRRKI